MGMEKCKKTKQGLKKAQKQEGGSGWKEFGDLQCTLHVHVYPFSTHPPARVMLWCGM